MWWNSLFTCLLGSCLLQCVNNYHFLNRHVPILGVMFPQSLIEQTIVYVAHCATANRLGLPQALHTLIHWLLVSQSEPKSNMWRGGCIVHQYSIWVRKICNYFLARWGKPQHTEPDLASCVLKCVPDFSLLYTDAIKITKIWPGVRMTLVWGLWNFIECKVQKLI